MVKPMGRGEGGRSIVLFAIIIHPMPILKMFPAFCGLWEVTVGRALGTEQK